MIEYINITTWSLSLCIWHIIMSFSYFDFLTCNNTSYLENFFWINFVDLILKLYTSYCFWYNQAVILEFFYKIITIAYSLGNTYKSNNIENFKVITWLSVIKLLFYLSRIIIVLMIYFSYLWIRWPGSNIRA